VLSDNNSDSDDDLAVPVLRVIESTCNSVILGIDYDTDFLKF